MDRFICFAVIVSFLCLGYIPCVSTNSFTSFQLTFPLEPHSAYARLLNTIATPLHEFTLCHWARIRNVSDFGSIFSYATTDAYNNELLSIILPNGKNHINRRERVFETNSSTPFNKWTHHCTTWSAYNQEFHAFRNGKEVSGYIQRGPVHSNPILPGGVIIIGQDQDIVGGGLDINQSFNGDISEIHFWDHILCHDEISRLSKCQGGNLEGNALSWRKSIFSFSGPVFMSHVNLCEDTC